MAGAIEYLIVDPEGNHFRYNYESTVIEDPTVFHLQCSRNHSEVSALRDTPFAHPPRSKTWIGWQKQGRV